MGNDLDCIFGGATVPPPTFYGLSGIRLKRTRRGAAGLGCGEQIRAGQAADRAACRRPRTDPSCNVHEYAKAPAMPRIPILSAIQPIR